MDGDPTGLYDEVCDILTHLPHVQRFSIVSHSPAPNDRMGMYLFYFSIVPLLVFLVKGGTLLSANEKESRLFTIFSFLL